MRRPAEIEKTVTHIDFPIRGLFDRTDDQCIGPVRFPFRVIDRCGFRQDRIRSDQPEQSRSGQIGLDDVGHFPGDGRLIGKTGDRHRNLAGADTGYLDIQMILRKNMSRHQKRQTKGQ